MRNRRTSDTSVINENPAYTSQEVAFIGGTDEYYSDVEPRENSHQGILNDNNHSDNTDNIYNATSGTQNIIFDETYSHLTTSSNTIQCDTYTNAVTREPSTSQCLDSDYDHLTHLDDPSTSREISVIQDNDNVYSNI